MKIYHPTTAPQCYNARQLTSAKATPERIYTCKTGDNKGQTRTIKAKPARVGILPITEKTLWQWAKEGKFPKPVKLNGSTVWLASEVHSWIEQNAEGQRHA